MKAFLTVLCITLWLVLIGVWLGAAVVLASKGW